MNPSVRLLHVTTVPESLIGFLSGHIRHAKERGVEVHAATSPGPLLDRFALETQVAVHPVSMLRRITPLRDLGALWRLTGIIREVQPTIVHGSTPKGGLLAMMAARTCRVPIRIYHILGLPFVTASGMKRRLLRLSERTSCRLANQVLCISQSLRDLAISEGLCPAEKIKVLNHGNIDGVDAQTRLNPLRLPAATRSVMRAKYQIPADALVAGFVGRIVRDKGLIELTRAWQTLRVEFPSLHLLVAGPFESQDPVPADVENVLRSDPRIHLAGYVADVPSLYRAIDLLVLPTYREGFGTVLLEAAAMELPVVTTRVPGCMDAVRDGETGLLVPAQDAGALADSIRIYLSDAELRRRHGLCGRERVLRDFNPEVMRETLYQEYLRLLHERSIAA